MTLCPSYVTLPYRGEGGYRTLLRLTDKPVRRRVEPLVRAHLVEAQHHEVARLAALPGQVAGDRLARVVREEGAPRLDRTGTRLNSSPLRAPPLPPCALK